MPEELYRTKLFSFAFTIRKLVILYFVSIIFLSLTRYIVVGCKTLFEQGSSSDCVFHA